MGTLRLLGLVAVAIGLAGCASGKPGSRIPQERTILSVENQGFADMTIYAVDGARRTRIGLATGHQTTEMTIPSSVANSAAVVRFLADPVGSNRTSVSNEVYVTPGRKVILIIPPQ